MKATSLVILIVFVLIGTGCDRGKKAQQHSEETSKLEWQKAITEFAKKYNAETDWESKIPKRGSLSSPFSIDISRALTPTNEQPVLLIMELKDIVEKKGDYSAVFDGYFFENQSFQVCLDVKCTRKLAERILQMSKDKMLEFASFAVIAKIENISRVGFEVQGTTGGTPEGDPPELEVVYSPDTFIARGTCVDVIQREDILSSP